jgi:hypothetical protein
MLTLSSAARCFAPLALLALAPRAERLEFAPPADTVAPMTYEIRGGLSLGDFSVTIDGQDLSAQVPVADFAAELAMELSVSDRFLDVRDGRPTRFERSYQSSKSRLAMAEQKDEASDLFEVDGETILFEWSKSQDAYVLSFKDGEGRMEALEGLGADLHLRSLLPAGEIEVGATWQLEPEALVPALMLGMEVRTLTDTLDSGAVAEEFDDALNPLLEDILASFRARCELVGVRDLEGRRCAEVKLTLEAEGELDGRAAILEALGGELDLEGIEVKIDAAELRLVLGGEGKLLWDLDTDVAHSFALDAKLELSGELSASATDSEGIAHDVEAMAELFAELAWKMN